MLYIGFIRTCSIASTVPGAGTARVPAAGAGTRSHNASSLQYLSRIYSY